jgi:hypothetical protein
MPVVLRSPVFPGSAATCGPLQASAGSGLSSWMNTATSLLTQRRRQKPQVMRRPAVLVLDVNETPSDLGLMRERFQQVGLPTCAGR